MRTTQCYDTVVKINLVFILITNLAFLTFFTNLPHILVPVTESGTHYSSMSDGFIFDMVNSHTLHYAINQI